SRREPTSHVSAKRGPALRGGLPARSGVARRVEGGERVIQVLGGVAQVGCLAGRALQRGEIGLGLVAIAAELLVDLVGRADVAGLEGAGFEQALIDIG